MIKTLTLVTGFRLSRGEKRRRHPERLKLEEAYEAPDEGRHWFKWQSRFGFAYSTADSKPAEPKAHPTRGVQQEQNAS
jgi:hypothetical protein